MEANAASPPEASGAGAVAAILAGKPDPVEASAGIDAIIATVAAEASAVVAEVAASSRKKKNPKAEAGGQDTGEEEEGLSEEMKAKIEAAKQKTLNALNVVRGTLDGLSNYQQQLHQLGDEQLRLEEQMKEAIENSRRMRARIREEQERVIALQEQAHVMEPEDDGEGRRV
ncbi:uncharacterized protein LOC135102291 [Scylla paramamosain]|uniref:uncharacterized protein LOC135102291 n=1 Tax=Scylla paramamosain TaxID=85552 RepID=UPI003082B913